MAKSSNSQTGKCGSWRERETAATRNLQVDRRKDSRALHSYISSIDNGIHSNAPLTDSMVQYLS
jgi:hypothetical protein